MKKLLAILFVAFMISSCSDRRDDNRFSITIDVDGDEIEDIINEALNDVEESLELEDGHDDIVIKVDVSDRDVRKIREQIRKELRNIHRDLKDVKITIERDVEDLP